MGEIVNLRRVKKAKARADAAAQAAENRITSGQTKAERHEAETAKQSLVRSLDGKKIVRDPAER